MWAIIGGVVLIAGVVAIVVVSLLSRPDAEPTGAPSSEPGMPSATSDAPVGEFVDETVTEKGWTPEPITTDPAVYIRAALEAASTFDTTTSTREEWLGYLDTWFTPDTRYAAKADQEAAMEASQLELVQGVVLPELEWESLASEDGRVVAEASGEIVYVPVSDDASGDMKIGTSDVTLTFTRSDSDGQESSYEERVRVSVQVLCGQGSVPTPDTGQQAGDCKVVRYFTEPMEP
jgi:hypothetical protein